MKDIDETKQPLLEHLIELRRRLLWCLATLIVTFFICFAFASQIFAVLVQPLLKAGQGKLIYTDVFEAFFVQVKVGLFAALMVSFPVIATQLHFVYLFRGGSWIALDANYYSGGRTTVNGVEQNDELGNSRLGLTYSYPWDRQHSLKLYASEGISVRFGTDFTVVGLAWQYRWGDAQ